MSVRRLVSVLSVCLVASATIVAAQPKQGAPAPAKDPAPPADAGSAGSGEAAGSAVEMAEDPPPEDMEGTNENPDAPRTIGGQPVLPPTTAPDAKKTAGYPIEEVLRPITLPQNMSEVSLDLHAQLSPYTGAGTLRARYGITRQVQLGLTYLAGGIYAQKDFAMGATGSTKFHPGKAVGLDVTILLQNWIGLRIGVPVYVDPLAIGVTIGAPLKFVFGDKLALGGLDDLVVINANRFAPSFYLESANFANVRKDASSTIISRGELRFSGYAMYQHKPNLAIIGRVGGILKDFSATRTNANEESGLKTFIRAGLQVTPKKFLDVGGSLGWDDLAELGSFGPQVYVNVRI